MSPLVLSISVALAFFSIGIVVGGQTMRSVFETATVQHHCAHYDPQTSKFTWFDTP